MDNKHSKNNSDYLLALGSMINLLESLENNESSRVMHLAKRSFLHREIPYYDKYLDINKSNKNETQINEINSIINSINKNRLNGVTEYKTLKPLFNQLTKRL
jgi:hypothetical protein